MTETLKDMLEALPAEIKNEITLLTSEVEKLNAGLPCNDICQDCKTQAHNNLVSCASHANSPEAHQECQAAYRAALQGCWS